MCRDVGHFGLCKRPFHLVNARFPRLLSFDPSVVLLHCHKSRLLLLLLLRPSVGYLKGLKLPSTRIVNGKHGLQLGTSWHPAPAMDDLRSRARGVLSGTRITSCEAASRLASRKVVVDVRVCLLQLFSDSNCFRGGAYFGNCELANDLGLKFV